MQLRTPCRKFLATPLCVMDLPALHALYTIPFLYGNALTCQRTSLLAQESTCPHRQRAGLRLGCLLSVRTQLAVLSYLFYYTHLSNVHMNPRLHPHLQIMKIYKKIDTMSSSRQYINDLTGIINYLILVHFKQ